MQTREVTGTIERGTIIVGVNTTESGVKGAKAIMDYYIQDKNKYQIFAYLQIGDNDNLHTIFDNIIECQYSKLEDWFKQCIKDDIKRGNLRKLFKNYEVRLNNGITFQNYEVAEAILLDDTDNGYNTAINWNILNVVFNDCMNKKIKKISLSADIVVRSGCFENVIRTTIIGNTVGVITFIKSLGSERSQYYDCEVTYDSIITSIKLKMMESGKQLDINVSIIHSNRFAERELESFIISKANSVKFINKESSIREPLRDMQVRDAIELDTKISLSTGVESTQFSDFFWRNLGRRGQYGLIYFS